MTCTRCGFELTGHGITQIEPIECPVCGKQLAEPISRLDSPSQILKTYLHDLREILFHPTDFYRRMPTSGGLTRPLCFALITHWIGGALGTFALLILWSLFSKSFRLYSPNLMPSSANFFSHSPFFERGSIHHWFFGLVPVILDPFITLFSILFTSLFVYIGARILIPFKRNAQTKNTQTKYTQDGKAVTYESIVRIFCFGMSPSILTAIPLLGGGVSSIWVFVLNLIGMREIYKISTARSLVVLFFPSIVFFGMIALGFLIILVLAMQFLATFFV